MAKRTPGPWQWDGDDLWHFGEGYEVGTTIADPHRYTGVTIDTRLRESPTLKANMALIVEAPEMLAALKEAQVRVFMADGSSALYDRIGALIARIEGAA